MFRTGLSKYIRPFSLLLLFRLFSGSVDGGELERDGGLEVPPPPEGGELGMRRAFMDSQILLLSPLSSILLLSLLLLVDIVVRLQKMPPLVNTYTLLGEHWINIDAY